MDNRSILIALHETEGIGWKTIQQLLTIHPELTEVLEWNEQDFELTGFSQKKAAQLTHLLQSLDDKKYARLLQEYEDRGIGVLTLWDDNYPVLLKHTSQPPWVLYYKGEPDYLQLPCIGMVGTRTPTAYGKRTAEDLAEALSAAGLCVVSGLARGIDSASHEGALRQRGSTIGVLGCGIDQIYPQENKRLFERVGAQGLIVSEYPFGTKPRPGLFPQRNRIIAGLSLGVVVVEAALKSGSLITMDQALEESRDVFAVPGPITSPKSQGTLALLKQGAKLVTCVKDIVEEYAHRISLDESAYINRNRQLEPLTNQEQKIIDILTFRSCHIDELLLQSQFTFGLLHSVLLNLQLKKRIVELPGSVYTIP
ncbi:DNA-processing protein DprA [Paenibacillus sp. GD4]|nr:DNA-processing protein DprA [Paenibacillus sp. GD4]MDQ1913295.1 DNA-processing protein DprA [Paenibacillus sp. GD4]